jgi:hypothetical protein
MRSSSGDMGFEFWPDIQQSRQAICVIFDPPSSPKMLFGT